MDEPTKKPSPNKGVPHKNTKYSQELLKELEYDVAVQIKLHLEDVERRIATEKAAYKPRKNLLLELSKEQATMVRAILPYHVVKPTGDSPVEETRRAPMAIKLTL
jgi:hypothetical protein